MLGHELAWPFFVVLLIGAIAAGQLASGFFKRKQFPLFFGSLIAALGFIISGSKLLIIGTIGSTTGALMRDAGLTVCVVALVAAAFAMRTTKVAGRS